MIELQGKKPRRRRRRKRNTEIKKELNIKFHINIWMKDKTKNSKIFVSIICYLPMPNLYLFRSVLFSISMLCLVITSIAFSSWMVRVRGVGWENKQCATSATWKISDYSQLSTHAWASIYTKISSLLFCCWFTYH